jgi:hypothetical protein
MIKRIMPGRGLASLRTLTGRSATRVPAHKAYLQISFLELERARHDQEIGTARARLDRMLARCQEIEREKAEILAAAGQAPVMPATPAAVRTLRQGRRRFGVAY